MFEILNFLKTYEVVIYFVFGVAASFYVYRFTMAWMGIRASVFGLELVSAQRKLNRSAMGLFVLLFFTVIVFVLITFVSPVVTPELSVPDLDGSIASIATQQSENGGLPIDNAETPALPTPLSTVAIYEDGCVAGEIEITSPESGETIRGVISISGTVNVSNLGHYRVEVANPQWELWETLGAGSFNVNNDVLLESFDTSDKIPGDYIIQLVVKDNENNSLTPCRIPVVIAAPEE